MSWRSPSIRFCTLLMESMWTYAVVAFSVAAITYGGDPSFIGVCFVVFASYGISRFLQDSDFSLGVIRVWGTILSFLIFYGIIRVDFFGNWRFWDFSWANDLFYHTEDTMRDQVAAVFGVPMLMGFWARGVLRGQESNTFDDVVASFGIGVLIVAFVEVFQGRLNDSPALVGQIAVPFVAFGLFAIGLAHSAQAETDRGRPFERTLLTAVGFSILALAAVAAVVALFDVATGWQAARDGTGTLLDVAGDVGKIVAWPLLQLLNGIFAVIIWLRDLILGTPPPPQVQPQPMDEGADCIRALMDDRGLSLEQATRQCNPQPGSLPEWVQVLVRIIIATPFVGLAILAVALLFNRFRKRGRPGELKESAYVSGRLASDLTDLWHGLLNRLRPNIHFGREHLDPVRRLYFDLLDDGERRGVERKPHQTPNELVPALDGAFHAATPGHITAAFDEARYGERLPPEADVRRLREEWERLRQN